MKLNNFLKKIIDLNIIFSFLILLLVFINFYDSDHLTRFGEEKFSSILADNLESKFIQLQDN